MVKWHLIIKQNSNSNGFTGGGCKPLGCCPKTSTFSERDWLKVIHSITSAYVLFTLYPDSFAPYDSGIFFVGTEVIHIYY